MVAAFVVLISIRSLEFATFARHPTKFSEGTLADLASCFGGWDIINSLLMALPAGKDGGRVTPKGIGKAKRGFGRAMKRKR